MMNTLMNTKYRYSSFVYIISFLQTSAEKDFVSCTRAKSFVRLLVDL